MYPKCIHDVYNLYPKCIRSIGKVSIVYILIKPNGFIDVYIIILTLYFYLFNIKQGNNINIYNNIIIYKYIINICSTKVVITAMLFFKIPN